MSNTMVKLDSITVGSGGASSVTFSNISQKYTDLLIKMSTRTNRANAGSGDPLQVTMNGVTTSLYRDMVMRGNGTAASSFYDTPSTSTNASRTSDGGSTASVFGSTDFYIPNYANNYYKSTSSQGVSENNATLAYIEIAAGQYRSMAPVTSVTITPVGSFVQYSVFTLYGIFKADVTGTPSTPTIGTATALGPTNATVAFTEVSNAASYTATSSPSGITATSISSPILVTGLAASTAYTFTVVANNPYGSSAASSASNSITTTASAFIQPFDGSNFVNLSGNGINWFPVTVASNINDTGGWSCIKHGSTYVVSRNMTNTNGGLPIVTSTDLINWTGRSITSTTYSYLTRIATNQTTFIAGGGAGGYNSSPVLYSTTDFTTWTLRTSGLTYNIYCAWYANGYYIIADGNGNYAYSTNGTSFTGASFQWLSGGVPNIGLYFNSRWIMAGNGGVIGYTTSMPPAGNWTAATGQNANQIQSGWQNGSLVVFGHNGAFVSRSSNGTTYTNSSTGASEYYVTSLMYGAGLWVYGGGNGVVYTSPDATTWTQRTSGLNTNASYPYGGFYG